MYCDSCEFARPWHRPHIWIEFPQCLRPMAPADRSPYMHLVRSLRPCLLTLVLALSANLVHADFNSLTLPAPFQKNVPETVKDLEEIEQHVKKLVAKVTPATVGLQIGGNSGSGVIVKDGYILTAGHVS